MNKGFRTSLAIAAGTALAAALLACALWVSDPYANEPFTDIIPSGPTSVVGIMIALCSLLTIWGGTIYFRCSDKVVRRYLLHVVVLLVLWQIITTCKYNVNNPQLNELLWYLFYLPFIFEPLLFLFSVGRVCGLDQQPWAQRVRRTLAALCSVLLLLVLTNSLHHQVFDFAPSISGGVHDYSYEWGYFLILGCIVALILVTLILIARRARRTTAHGLVLVAVTVALLLTYGIMYITRTGTVYTGNITFVYTLFIAVITETCLQLRIFPTFERFRQVFAELPLDLKITDAEGTLTLQTKSAQPMLPALQDRLKRKATSTSTFSLSETPGITYKIVPISGGSVLLSEDTSVIDENQRRLAQLQGRLQRQNKLLQQDNVMKAHLYKQQRKRALYAEIRGTLSSTVGEIRRMIDELPGQDTPEEAAARKLQLMKIKMLVAYCKRKGSLILNKSDANPDFNRERILLVTNETAADLRTSGIGCATLVETRESLPAETMSILYDCFYDFCMASFSYDNPVIMVFLHDKPGSSRAVEMKIALESDNEETPNVEASLEKLRSTLAQSNVAYNLTSEDGSLYLTVLAQKAEPSEPSAPGAGTHAKEAARE